MGSESELILSLWETFRDIIPASKREEAASKMLRIIGDWGIDLEDMADELHGEDTYLDRAFENYVDVDGQDEDDSYFGDDDY